MKRSTILRRLMNISMIFELVYLLLITIIYIFRPEFYTNALVSVFNLQISEIPVNDPKMELLITLYGEVIVYFILWFILKLMMDKDANPLAIGVISFIFMPASTVVNTYMYGRLLNEYAVEGVEVLTFHSMNFTVIRYCGWASIGAVILLLMAYAVCRQRFADLD